MSLYCFKFSLKESFQRIFKPMLTASEVCHRLALSEEQKENKQKKEKTTKMEMKTCAIYYITCDTICLNEMVLFVHFLSC
jgi:hypothetical protein